MNGVKKLLLMALAAMLGFLCADLCRSDEIRYDAQGNRTGKSVLMEGVKVDYDAQGRRIGKTVVNGDEEIHYDAQGNRTGKTVLHRSFGDRTHYDAQGKVTGGSLVYRTHRGYRIELDILGSRVGKTVAE